VEFFEQLTTSVHLQDIWGIDDTHIWATGRNSGDGHSVVLQYDGSQWTTLYDSEVQPTQTKHQFSTLWTDTPSKPYLDGGELYVMDLEAATIGTRISTGQSYLSGRIRGTASNDIFDVGQASEAAHYNGSSWLLYPKLKEQNGGFAPFLTVYPTKDFVLIGGFYSTGLNEFPVVVRGYR
jgi:hypothetical protein